MEGQIPKIRLKKGGIKFNAGHSLEFIFGLVYFIRGEYLFELHFDQAINLEEFYDSNRDYFLNGKATIEASTSEGNEFVATQILMKNFPFHKSMGDFYCSGYIQTKQISRFPRDEEESSESVHFVILDGLKLTYNMHSKFQSDRFGKNDKFPFKKDGTFDYTSAIFQVREFEHHQFLLYNKEDNQVVLEFSSNEGGYHPMSYTLWKEIKLDFIEFISFLNGSTVTIREEHYGNFYSPQKLNAEFSVFYSIERIIPKRRNDYMAINNSWYRSEQIIQKAFMNNFHIYREKNKSWDLNTIIFYLNNAEQTSSLGDRIFIQTILLERLSSKFGDMLEEDWTTIVPTETFEIVQSELLQILSKHKNKIGSLNYNTIKGRLMEVNKAKRKSNILKFKNLIDGVGIEVTDSIEQLLIKRHAIIHYGEIGEFEDAYRDFELMDKLIRKIIVNIIQYDGATIEDGKHYQNPPAPLVKNKQ